MLESVIKSMALREYKDLSDEGLLWEMYPECTGNFSEDILILERSWEKFYNAFPRFIVDD